jgi:hypothetical protein
MKKPLTEQKAIMRLFSMLRSSSDLIIPRFTPRNWWECDVWRLTKSGYIDEFEIKLSLSDFKADSLKAQTGRYHYDPEARKLVEKAARNKHDLLANSLEGPNRFWFVLPSDLADKVTVPEWAGLMALSSWGGVNTVKQAPKRHRKKWDGDRAAILQTFYYRYWNIAWTTKEIEHSEEPCKT